MSGKSSGYQKFFRDARRNAKSPSTPTLTPEQQVLRQLAEQSNQRRKAKRSKRRPPPVFAMILLGVSVATGVAGVLMPDALDSIDSVQEVMASLNLPHLPKISLGFLGHANATEKKDGKDEKKKDESKPDAAEKSAAAAKSAGDKKPEEAEAAAAKGQETNPDLRQWTAEEMSFFKRLNDRKLELDRREAELAKLEEELQKQRVGIEEKIKQLETMRAEISATLKGRVEQDQEKVAKLVDVYSNMKPVSASRVIETLNEDLAVTILDRMKKKNAAEILNMMSAAKARKLSEMLTGYRQPASEKNEEAKSETK